MKLKQVPRRLRSSLRYVADYRRFAREHAHAATGFPEVRWSDARAMLGDATTTTGFDRHYVYHTAWAARVLAQTRPEVHHDFGSLLYFSTLASAFVPVRFYDYRPAPIELDGLESLHADLTALEMADGSLTSASCMHVLEHIGLGRYGDPIDPAGDRLAADELQRVVAPGGDLLIVLPVGKPKVCFNAHRVYSYELVLETFSRCELAEFSLVPDPDKGPGLIRGADPATVAEQDYACGCFWFRKESA